MLTAWLLLADVALANAEAMDPADLPPLPVALMVFGALLALSFFFSGTETAFFSLQDRDRRRYAEGETLTDRRIDALLEKRTGLITTILMGNEFVNVTFSSFSAALVALLFPEYPWVNVFIAVPVLVLFSEITPKIIAYRFNRSWAAIAVWPITAIYWILIPLRLGFTLIVTALSRLFGVTEAHGPAEIREEEFLVRVEQAAERGVVGGDEHAFIQAVFELDDVAVSRLMTPRPDMFSLALDTPWTALLAACQEAGYSRVPVYEDDPDNVVGVLLVKDLLRHRRRPLTSPEALRGLLVPPVFVPGTRSASEMMRDMIRRRIHMAFVVDEHGTIIGLVSLDDLIVELVGELGDEDDDSTSHSIEQHDGSIAVDGALDIDDFREETDITIPEGEYHTVGGFVFHTLGRIPEPGDTCDADGHRFEVTEMDGRRVSRVRVRPVPAGEAGL